MSFFDIFRKKQDDYEPGRRERPYKFSDDDRRLSAEVRRKKAELQMEIDKLNAEKEKLRLNTEIEELKQQYEDLTASDEEEPPQGGSTADTLLTALLAMILKGNTSPTPQPITPQPQISGSPVANALSDEQLQEIWGNIPEMYKQKAKKMKDADLANFIKFQMPTADQDTIERAIRIVRAK